jgi:hypothetical protein
VSWVGRFGSRPHGIVTQDELFALLAVAIAAGRKCWLCDRPAAGVVHCNDCGWTQRLCDVHRPKTEAVEHFKRLTMPVLFASGSLNAGHCPITAAAALGTWPFLKYVVGVQSDNVILAGMVIVGGLFGLWSIRYAKMIWLVIDLTIHPPSREDFEQRSRNTSS